MWAEFSCFLSREMGMSGNFLSCSKGVQDPLEVPEFRREYSRDAAEKMGLISTEAENLLDFHELRQVLSTYTVTSGTV